MQLTVLRGNPATYTFTALIDGAAVDLTNAAIAFDAAPLLAITGVAAISKSVGVGVTPDPDQVANKGKFTVALDGADTSGFPDSPINLAVTITVTPDGGVATVVDEGILTVLPRMYISVSDLRDAGLSSATADDATVQAAILLWQQLIERATRQWFVPRTLSFYFDGNDSPMIGFAVPIISISELRINSSTTALDATLYKVYNRTFPDDRRNPRIKLLNGEALNDIYTAPMLSRRMRFRHGQQNQYVSGVFGYVEADGSPPPLIRRALVKLVLEKYAAPAAAVDQPALISQYVTEETTDGHSIKYYQGANLKARPPGLSGLTYDEEVQEILKLYRAPIGVAVPGQPSY